MKQFILTLTLLLSVQLSFTQDCEMNETKMANSLKDIESIKTIDNKIHFEFPAFTYIIPKGDVILSRIASKINVSCSSKNKCIEKDIFLNVLPDSQEEMIYLEINDHINNTEIKCLVDSLNKLVGNKKGHTSIYDKLLDFDSENDNSKTTSTNSKLIKKTENSLHNLNNSLSTENQLLDYKSQILTEIKDVPDLLLNDVLTKWSEASDRSSLNQMKSEILSTKTSVEYISNRFANANKIAQQAHTLTTEKNLNKNEQLKWSKIQSLLDDSFNFAKVIIESYSIIKADYSKKVDVSGMTVINIMTAQKLMEYQTQIGDKLSR